MEVLLDRLEVGDQFIAYSEHYEITKIEAVDTPLGRYIRVTATLMRPGYPRIVEETYGPPSLTMEILPRD